MSLSERFIELFLGIAIDLVGMWVINKLSEKMESKIAKVLVKILMWVYFGSMIYEVYLKLEE